MATGSTGALAAGGARADLNLEQYAGSGHPGQLAARRHQLLAQMMADPANLDIAFEYATLSSQAGDLEGAISTLERMLIYAPGLPRLDLELGVLYFRLGANDSARSYFEAALTAPDVPDEVRRKVDSYLAAIDKSARPDGFSGSITMGGRYQSNANSGPSSAEVKLNGIPFVLSSDGMGHPDGNGFIAGNLRYSHDLESQGDRLLATLSTYGALYAVDGTLNTGVVEATAGPELNLERIDIEDATLGLYGIAAGVLLSGSPYLLSAGLGADFETALDPRTHLGVRTEFRQESYQNSALRPRASDRNGSTIETDVTVQYQVTDSVSLFGVLTGERRLAQIGYLSLWQGGVSAGAAFAFEPPFRDQQSPWTLTVAAGYARRLHDGPDPIVSVSQAEVEHEAFVQATLSVPLADAWSIEAATGYRKVLSNYDLDTSDNFSFSVGIKKSF